MNEITKEKRGSFVFRFSVIVSILSFLIVLIIAGMQIYIRWFINKDFMVIGGNELEVLTASSFALIAVLSYIHRSERN